MENENEVSLEEQDILQMFGECIEMDTEQKTIELSHQMAIAPKVSIFTALESNPAYQQIQQEGGHLGIQSIALRHQTLGYLEASHQEDVMTKKITVAIGIFLALFIPLSFALGGGKTEETNQSYTSGYVK